LEHALPNLIVAGVNKAGTTSLFSALAEHPAVGASDVKETCHFLPLRYGERVPPISSYAAHFRAVAGRPVVVEATPGYFYGGDAIATEIDRQVPDVRVVIALREPVSRMLSFFRFQKAMLALPPDLSADEYVRRCLDLPAERLRRRDANPWFGVAGGRYIDHITAWTDTFGDRLRVLFFDDIRDDLPGVLVDLAAWLDIDPAPFASAAPSVENRTVVGRMRGLHRVALRVNRELEPRLRRQRRLKRLIRAAYLRVNGAEATEDLGDACREALVDYFAPLNHALAIKLTSVGVTRLATWLSPGGSYVFHEPGS
jgi:hypothetical protein